MRRHGRPAARSAIRERRLHARLRSVQCPRDLDDRRRLHLAQRPRRAGEGPPAPGHPRRTLPAGLADRRDAGGPRARHEPGARPRGAPRARGPRGRGDPPVPRREGQASDHRGAARGVRGPGGARVPGGAPRRADDDGRGPGRARDAPRGHAAGRPGGGPARGRGRRTRPSTPTSCTSPTTPPWSGCGRRSSRSRGPTSRWSPRAPARSGRPASTRPSCERCRSGDVDAVEAALRHHFREASEHLASGWQEQADTR